MGYTLSDPEYWLVLDNVNVLYITMRDNDYIHEIQHNLRKSHSEELQEPKQQKERGVETKVQKKPDENKEAETKIISKMVAILAAGTMNS
eukprot:8231192-Ditylum_brightwellii.AAC.1